MNRAVPTPPPAMTPTKVAMIVVLAIVLVVVLVVQFSGGESAPLVIKKRTPRNAPTETTGTASASALVIRLNWPEIQRDEVTAFNPFQIPDSLQPKPASTPAPAQSPQPIQIVQSSQSTSTQTTGPVAAQHHSKADDEQARIRAKERKSRLERIRATANDLQKQGVGLVVSTSAGAVARIGEQELRVGDVINGVLRIVAIDPQGIVVEEAPEDTTDD